MIPPGRLARGESGGSRGGEERAGERLDSWKAIAVYLNRSERTVRRWEANEGLPVHRLHHEKRGSVYAYRTELDSWWQSRKELALLEPWEGGSPVNGNSAPRQAGHRWRSWAAGTAIVAILSASAWLLKPNFPNRSLPGPAAIAVLPFEYAGSDKSVSYLSDGIAEEVTNSLARLPGLRVAAPSSVLRFKGLNRDLRDIGRRLNVGAILLGKVRAADGRLEVSGQLIDPADGHQLWSATYDRRIGELSAIGANIAGAVGRRLGLKDVDGKETGKSRTVKDEAYQLLLKARYSQATERSVKISLYRQALAYDSSYAEAYVGLAREWTSLAGEGAVPPRQVMEDARASIQKALELDGDLEDAHFVSAMVNWTYEWDWAAAEREFARTLQINPNSANARIQYARYLALMGRRQEALDQLEQIRVLDPLSANLGSIQAAVYYLTRDYHRTITHAKAVLASEPKHWLMSYWMGRAYDSLGQLPEAIAALETWHAIPGGLQGRGFGMLGSLYARSGRRSEALRLLENGIANSKRAYVSPCSIALLLIGLGEHDRAIEWLEQAYEQRDYSLVSLKAEPAYDPLRGHPKFVTLLRRLKLD